MNGKKQIIKIHPGTAIFYEIKYPGGKWFTVFDHQCFYPHGARVVLVHGANDIPSAHDYRRESLRRRQECRAALEHFDRIIRERSKKGRAAK